LGGGKKSKSMGGAFLTGKAATVGGGVGSIMDEINGFEKLINTN